MSSERTRKIVVAGVLGAISVLLGVTRLGFIPWFSGASLTIMHVPVIIGAVLEGPVVGMAVGLIFGGFSMLQAAIAPTGPADVWFTNPLLAVLPRLVIGPMAWLAYRALARRPAPASVAAGLVGSVTNTFLRLGMIGVLGHLDWALVAAGLVGSVTNTVLVLGMIGVLGHLDWVLLPPIALINGLPEAAASALVTLAVVAAWRRIEVGSRKGSRI